MSLIFCLFSNFSHLIQLQSMLKIQYMTYRFIVLCRSHHNLNKFNKMGNCCHKGGLPSDYDSTNIDEFYNPFAQLTSHSNQDPSILSQHGPRGVLPMAELPR